jgi:hypothetical protein
MPEKIVLIEKDTADSVPKAIANLLRFLEGRVCLQIVKGDGIEPFSLDVVSEQTEELVISAEELFSARVDGGLGFRYPVAAFVC